MDSQVEYLHSRADILATKFQQGDGTDYIDEAIMLDRDALDLRPPGHSKRLISLGRLATHLVDRFQRLGVVEDIDEAIVLDRDALTLCSPVHPDRSVTLSNLAAHLSIRYNRLRVLDDLNEAIVLDRDALALHPLGHPDRSTSLDNLSARLSTRHRWLGGLDDLNEALVLARDALALHPPGHPNRSASLNDLAVRLSTRYTQLGGLDDLNEAIALNLGALALRTPEHPGWSTSLNNLALCLSARYSQLGALDDLNKAIILSGNALVFCPPQNPNWSIYLNDFAFHLLTRYKQLGGLDDLDKAIALGRGALVLLPPGHSDRSAILNNISADLATPYKQLGGLDDLHEAIVLGRDALALCTPGNPDRSISLNNLSVCLSTRYERLEGLDDLTEAIVLAQDALALHPPGHPNRSSFLNNLATYLLTRHKQFGGLDDLNEAIVLSQDALVLHPPGHPDRSLSLDNLAVLLSSRYEQLGGLDDLNEAIVLHRDALALRMPGHPERSMSLSNLAVDLSIRYKQLKELDDLNEAIALNRDALVLRPPGHPNRSSSLDTLAHNLHTRFTHMAQSNDKEELFSLYAQLAHAPSMVSSTDLSTARKWARIAEYFQHPTRLLAYETSLRFLVHHLATLPSLPQHHAILKTHASSLAVDAFSACLRNGSLAKAVEFLEQGRGVFWSQLTRLRSPVDDVATSCPEGKVLADEFTHLTSLIRAVLDSPGATQHDRVFNLNVELQRVISKIHELPGLSHFLLPLPFSDLQQAACQGPVIIVNASQYSCDAVIVLVDRDPVHIPLSISKKDVQEWSSKLAALTAREKSTDVTRDLALILRELWNDVVSPIIDFLSTIHPYGSRIWWCPTAEFSSLPLHAAGPYRKGQQNLLDLYISSYTPTLGALIYARQRASRSPSSEPQFVAIGQARASGESELHSVGTELDNISQRVDALSTFTRIEGQESSMARVARELSQSEWVHFACHGIANRTKPFESAFALHDGRFTIEHILRSKLEHPQFAYLSACHTTVGDDKSPDEVIHLASAMQFAGFCSVIGTMWAVDDGATNKITSTFYENMKDEWGRLDYTRAAFALNKTMRSLTDIPFDQHSLYIHLGA